MAATIDTNIKNYKVDDLIRIFNINIPEHFQTVEDINKIKPMVIDRANAIIARMKTEKNSALELFFGDARDKLLDYLNELTVKTQEVLNDVTEPITKIWNENSFKENGTDQVKYFTDDSRFVADNINAKIKPDLIPIIATQIVNIDSQYRTNILPYSDNPQANTFNTHFTFNLSTPITKAINMSLYSYQIPTSWASFNDRSGNTYFMYNGIVIDIPDGNYTPQTLVSTLNEVAARNVATSGLVVVYDPIKNRISFTNSDTLSDNVTVIFFLQANTVNFSKCNKTNLTNFQFLGVNMTLGWLMGFRITPDPVTGNVSFTIASQATVSADVPPDTYGPKYFILTIEDYTNQRLSSGLYNITNTKNHALISVPDYFKTINVSCKLQSGSLTQAQLYAINAITEDSNVNNNVEGYANKLAGPSSGTAFAVIPLSDIKNIRPDPYIRYGADLNLFQRTYLSPTYLERLSVTLIDDKGNLVNLYDNDWSFSLIVQTRLN